MRNSVKPLTVLASLTIFFPSIAGGQDTEIAYLDETKYQCDLSVSVVSWRHMDINGEFDQNGRPIRNFARPVSRDNAIHGDHLVTAGFLYSASSNEYLQIDTGHNHFNRWGRSRVYRSAAANEVGRKIVGFHPTPMFGMSIANPNVAGNFSVLSAQKGVTSCRFGKKALLPVNSSEIVGRTLPAKGCHCAKWSLRTDYLLNQTLDERILTLESQLLTGLGQQLQIMSYELNLIKAEIRKANAQDNVFDDAALNQRIQTLEARLSSAIAQSEVGEAAGEQSEE